MINSPPPRLSRGQIVCYSIGHVLNDLTASCWFTYLLIFLRTHLSFSQAGIVFLSGQIADGLATPPVGILSDATKHDGFFAKTLGRRKSWLALGAIAVTLFFGLVFPVYSDHIGESIAASLHTTGLSTIDIVVFSIAAALFNVGWAMLQVNHLAMVPELSSVDSDRVLMYSLRNAFGVLSNIAVFGMFSLFTVVAPDQVWRLLGISVLAIGCFCTLVFLLGVKELNNHIEIKEMHADSDPAIHGDWKSWFYLPSFYTVTIVYMASRLTVNVSQVYLVIFSVNSMGMDMQSQSMMPLALYLASFVANFLIKPLSRRMKLKWVFAIGSVLSSCALAVFWILAEERLSTRLSDSQTNISYGVVLLLGAGNAMVLVTALSMEARLVGANRKSGAFVYGAMSFVEKVANGLAVFVINILTTQCEHCADDNPPKAFGVSMQYVFALVPAISAIIGTVFAQFPKFVEEEEEYTLLSAAEESPTNSRLQSSLSSFVAVDSATRGVGGPVLVDALLLTHQTHQTLEDAVRARFKGKHNKPQYITM